MVLNFLLGDNNRTKGLAGHIFNGVVNLFSKLLVNGHFLSVEGLQVGTRVQDNFRGPLDIDFHVATDHANRAGTLAAGAERHLLHNGGIFTGLLDVDAATIDEFQHSHFSRGARLFREDIGGGVDHTVVDEIVLDLFGDVAREGNMVGVGVHLDQFFIP